MRSRLAGDAVWPWKSAAARDWAQRPLNVAKTQIFCKSFHAARHRSGLRATSLSFACERAGKMHHFCGSTIAASSARIPSPLSPAYPFVVHLCQRGKGSNRVNSLNLFSLANS